MSEAQATALFAKLRALPPFEGARLVRNEPDEENPLMLGLVVCMAMIASCVVSGISGALIPLGHGHRRRQHGIVPGTGDRAGAGPGGFWKWRPCGTIRAPQVNGTTEDVHDAL